jgi:hypothetical protein
VSPKTVGGAGPAGVRPPEVSAVLKESPEVRKEFYRDYRVAHRNIVATSEELIRLIREPADAEVIYLIGGTGVGKTTVMKHVIAKLNEMALPTLGNFPGRIPAAYIEAENPDKRSYDWSEHYVNTMIALDEVLIDKKVYLPGPYEAHDTSGFQPRWEKRRAAALRRGAENTLMNRIMYAFFIDEAQYITKRRSGEGLMNQADTIRSIAARSKTLHVLVGTYDLRHLRNLNGQLGRRSHTVYFRPYMISGLSGQELDRESEAFTEAFLSLQSHLPLDQPPDLIRHLEFCYERCVGCVGLLKNWFRRSLAMALDDNSKTINSEMFLRAAPKKEVWERIAQEIADGEEALKETDAELEAELAKLNVVNYSPGTLTVNKKLGDSAKRGNTSTVKKGSSSKSRKGGRPFTPKPERYPLGINKNAN